MKNVLNQKKALLLVAISSSILYSLCVFPYATSPNLQNNGVMSDTKNGLYDESIDYRYFLGRVTDRDDLGTTIKVSSENNNIKFFKAGDPINFKIKNKKMPLCRSNLKTVENQYVILFVKNLGQCWKHENFVRRGTQIDLYSKVLASRVKEASSYRNSLLSKKKSYMSQLSRINNSIWGHDQNKVQVAAKYEKEILRIREIKQRAVEHLFEIKKDNIILQQNLTSQLKEIDKKLDFYKIEPIEQLIDRWSMDQNLQLPFGNRPPKF
jgi:hypothetical protein